MNRTQIRTLVELTYGTVGLALVVWAAMRIPPGWHSPTLLLIVVVFFLAPFSFRLTDPIRLPGAMPVETAVLLIAPPPVSIIVAGFTNLFTSLRHKRPLTRSYFNAANMAIPNGLATLVLVTLIDGWPQPLLIPAHIPIIALVIAVRMVSNLLCTTLVLYLDGLVGRYWAYVGRTLHNEWVHGGFGLRLLPVLVAIAFPIAGWWGLGMALLLMASISRSVARFQDRIETQSLVDGLTGLRNRLAWEQALVRDRPGAAYSVAVIDVNGLKRTNDTFGHAQGDTVLVDLARRLQLVARDLDDCAVFRVGGDEFVLVVPSAVRSTEFCQSLHSAVEGYSRHWLQLGIPASASVGFAICPAEAASLRAAFTLADQRMYRVKSGHPTSLVRSST